MSAAVAPVSEVQKSLEDLQVQPQERKERTFEKDGIVYKTYLGESQLHIITDFMKKDLSEPYSVYTYRYFINNWPDLCWLVRNDRSLQNELAPLIPLFLTPIAPFRDIKALSGDKCIGAIVCKQEEHKGKSVRGYIAMLAVDSEFRGKGIGTCPQTEIKAEFDVFIPLLTYFCGLQGVSWCYEP